MAAFKIDRKRIAASVLAGAMVLGSALSPMTAFAASPGITYEGVAGGASVVVEKYLIMDTNANVPNVTFNYTITPGAAQNATPGTTEPAVPGTYAVYAGNDANKVSGQPTIGTAVFAAGDTTYTTPQSLPASVNTVKVNNATDPITAADLTGKKYARKDIVVNFSSVTFKEPGIYRYIITESALTGNSSKGITNDSDATRVMDVYVQDVDNACVIQGYVLHNNADDAVVPISGENVNPTDKSAGYVNRYETEDLTLSKAVAGNQASRDEYFEFTVNISGLAEGTRLDVDLSNADATTTVNAINTAPMTNEATLTAPASGTITKTFWLQGGQSILIKGLPKDASYTVTENKATLTREGYTPSAVITGDTKNGDATTGESNVTMAQATTEVADTQIQADTTVAYTNTKNGVLPTGITMTVLPAAAALAAACCGFAFNKKRKKTA